MIDFALLAEHLQAFKKRQKICVPKYDFGTHTRSVNSSELEPKRVLFVEGILLFFEDEIRRHIDLKIYMAADERVRFERRMYRDTRFRGRTEASVREQWSATVVPMYQKFVSPTRHFSHIVIDTSDESHSTAEAVADLAGQIHGMLS